MSAPAYTLAIETSNPSAGPRGRVTVASGDDVLAGPGVALGRLQAGTPPGSIELVGEEPLSEADGGPQTRSSGLGVPSDDLMSAIDRLCRRVGVGPRALKRVAVSVGPGGYTGLRTAIAAAKMIAEGAGAETIPVPSAAVAAWCIEIGSAPAIVCLASKAETTHATLLPPAIDPWWEKTGRDALRTLLDAPALARLEESLSRGRSGISASCPIGVIAADQVEALRPLILIADRFLPDPVRAAAGRIGAAVVEPIFAASSVLAISARTPPVDPLTLAAIYPREPAAVTQWSRRVKGR